MNKFVQQALAKFNSLTPKQRQYALGGAVLAVIVVAAFGTSFLSGGGKPPPSMATSKDKPISTQIDAPGRQADPKAVWQSHSEGQLKDLQKQLQEMQRSMKKSEDERTRSTEERKKAEDALRRAKTSNPSMPDMPLPPYRGADVRGPTQVGGNSGSITGARPMGGQPGNAMPASAGQQPFPPGQGPRPAAIFSLDLGGETPVVNAALNTSAKRTTENYVFTGSITQAVLLSGLDAPTGGQAQSQPHPVLMRLTNLSILPSKMRYDMRECFVLGSGYGDISSERAYIRTEKISCKSRDGSVIDMEMKGFVSGPDGRVGVRGRLVTKQGALLMRALISGVASGIGDAFKQQYTTTSISPLGATQTIDKDKVVNSGIAGGVSTAMDRLSKYYIEMANKIFPVVEIDPGWPVDIIVTEGFYMDGSPATKATKAVAPGPARTNNLPTTPGTNSTPISASMRSGQ